jgi:hypothetical protein
MSMFEISIFAVPKPFVGHIGIIQRNAIESWRRLSVVSEIILIGDDPGVGDTAHSLGAVHVPNIELDAYAVPRVDSAFLAARAISKLNWLCYVNSDILLLPSFGEAVARVAARLGDSLVVSRRWNLDVIEPLEFDQDWAAKMSERMARNGDLFTPYGIDTFAFPKSMFQAVPDFSLGRFSWDNWLVHEARHTRFPVVDITEAAGVVHQNHAYPRSVSSDDLRRTQSALRNYWLAGDSLFGLSSVNDSTHVLKGTDIVRSTTRSIGVVIRHCGSVESLYACLQSLENQGYPRTFIEIVVVVGHDHVLSRAVMMDFPFIRMTTESKPGKAAARNKGAAIVQGDVLAFLDSHCTVAGDWLPQSLAAATDEDDRIVMPTVRRVAHDGKRSALSIYEIETVVEDNFSNVCGQRLLAPGLVVPRAVWRRVGPFNESFGQPDYAEWEWLVRAQHQGIRIATAPHAVVKLPVTRNVRQFAENVRQAAARDIKLSRALSDPIPCTFGGYLWSYTARFLREIRGIRAARRVPATSRLAAIAIAALAWCSRLCESRIQFSLPLMHRTRLHSLAIRAAPDAVTVLAPPASRGS